VPRCSLRRSSTRSGVDSRASSRADRGREWTSAALAGVACAAVAGWYYLRNWVALGVPFTLGSSYEGGLLPAGGAWWQEPGYRLIAQLHRFGSGLVRPFDAASHGFWDNYYSTLWADGANGSMIEFDVIPPWNSRRCSLRFGLRSFRPR
jgi:hypothetical protein